MALQFTWLGRNHIDRIAELRMRCYGTPVERQKFMQRTENDRFTDGDVLVLSIDGIDVATATSMRLTLNIRGNPVPCQGVAWVGTVRTMRRRRIEGRGLASHVMHALRDKARERGEVASMLAPFRVSFYERFGYGVVERQATWTVPLSVMPDEGAGHFREFLPGDLAAAADGRQRQFLQTHGDIETSERSVQFWLNDLRETGFRLIEIDGKTVRSQFTLGTEIVGGQSIAVVHRPWWDSPGALRAMLAMLGTLKDQYSAARITLPADFPLNWMLKERQVPHRRVDHSTSSCQLTTRMQAAIIDPVQFCAALRPAATAQGKITLAIRNHDGSTVRLALEFADGKVAATPTSAEPDAAMDDIVFAAIALGDLAAADARAADQLDLYTADALPLLDALSAGPKPYCHEYF